MIEDVLDLWKDLVTRISVLVLLASVSVMIILSIVAVLVKLTGIFVVMFTLIWYILIVECISKVPMDNGFNHLMVRIHVNIQFLQSVKDIFH